MHHPTTSIIKKSILLCLISTLLLYPKNRDAPIAIGFQGNKQISTSELEELVGAKKPSFLSFWSDDKSTINALYISKLDEVFRLYYEKEGFYEAEIRHTIDAKGIHFFIKENRYIEVKNIDIESDFDIDNVVKIDNNSRFRAKDFSDTKSAIKQKLLEGGYCNYDLDTKAYLNLESYSANIEIILKKGEVCRFGKITIEGSKSINDSVVLSRLKFRRGEPFDISLIRDSYESLYALEAFDQLSIKKRVKHEDILTVEKIREKYKSFYKLDSFDNIYNQIDGKKSRVIPMDVKFKEIQKHSHSRIGVGYATDLRFQTKYHWEYKNFYGGARKLLFDILLSEKQKKIENNLLNPAFFMLGGQYLDFQNSAGYSEERNIHNYDEKIAYDKLYLIYQGVQWSHSVGMGVENREISNDKSFFIIYPFIKLVYDLRDSKVNPTKGIYFSHQMEYGLPYSLSSTTYLKYLDELRVIYTVNGITLSTVGRIGAIKVYNNRIPESKKFFAGGAFSNRAYGYDKIGITLSKTQTLQDRGGYNLTNLSLEANFPIYKSFTLGLFSDNSMISDKQGVWQFSNRVISSAGFGFRYITPVGPFKIDFGFNLNDYSENAIHFQVGQSF